MNRITVRGNVGRDPIKIGSGTTMCAFSLADSFKKGNEFTCQWWRVVVFYEETATAVLAQVKKGQRVLVTGRVEV